MDSTYKMFFQEIGLNEGESLVYSDLLTNGESEARAIVERTGLGRGNTYNVVSLLERRGLIVAIHETAKTRYRATDPANLRTLLEQKQESVQMLKSHFEVVFPALVSQYVLSTGKPAIQIFEGLDGLKQSLEDTLTAKGEILTIVDPEVIQGEIARINTEYVAMRKKRGVHKRILMPDAPGMDARAERLTNEYTKARTCSGLASGFGSAIEIYDDRLSLLTIRHEHPICVLMENASMAALQRAQFEALWRVAAAS